MRRIFRRKRSGRRSVEEADWCRNCNRMKHDQEMHKLRDENEQLSNEVLKMDYVREERDQLKLQLEELEKEMSCVCTELMLQVHNHGRALESSCEVHGWDLVNQVFPGDEE